ncbi:unnamed protein product [Prunus armeniaca]
MGLGELELSKWVLSATPMERETVLRDLKKRKEKIVAVTGKGLEHIGCLLTIPSNSQRLFVCTDSQINRVL